MRTLLQFLPLLYFFFASQCIYAQEEYELLNFPQPGMSQGAVYYGYSPVVGVPNITDFSFQYDKDTIVCDKKYSNFLLAEGENVLMRYDNGKIYHGACESEILMYDFSLEKGDTFDWGGLLTLIVDTTYIITMQNGQKRKILGLTGEFGSHAQTWIDGIGDISKGFFRPEGNFEAYGGELICHKDSSGLVYLLEGGESDCDKWTCPFVRPAFTFEDIEKTVYFKNQSQNGETYEWTFGDGSLIDNSSNPVHTFEDSGCYDICLKVSNSCGRKDSLCSKIGVGLEEGWESNYFDFEFEYDFSTIRDAHFVNVDVGWAVSLKKIYKTIDGGKNWTQQSYPEGLEGNFRQFQSIHFFDNQLGIVTSVTSGTSDEDISSISNLLITKDGGETWKDVTIGGGAFYLDGVWASDMVAYVTGQQRLSSPPEIAIPVILTKDGGVSWEVRQVEDEFNGFDIFTLSEYIVFVAGSDDNSKEGKLAAS
ncbi:MAG: PKD domain-containing protein [Chitinophagales bacterium]